jgi:hypothetical protein
MNMRRVIEVACYCLLTVTALLVHGYHLGSDDAEIYLPAIEKVADPQLFPANSQFFMHHASLSLFSNLIGGSARLTGAPIDWVLFLWHLFSILLTLLATRAVLRICFESEVAQWAGVALVAVTLTVPVAGTALVIMDPYVTARSLSTPATLFAIASFVKGRNRRGWLWLLATALVHPQMSVYGAAFFFCLAIVRNGAPSWAASMATPLSFNFEPASGTYRDVLMSRTYFFVSNWTWWEWMGVWAPLVLIFFLARIGSQRLRPAFGELCRTLVFFGAAFTCAAFILASSNRLDSFARLQPMRAFHIVYVVMFALLGGLLGEFALKREPWRWVALFAPLAIGMTAVQMFAYPASPHIELPGVSYTNGWPAAFLWIRQHTPKNALFALDPDYMAAPGDDGHGFRAIAERSALADDLKDSGAVSLFPDLASAWRDQTNDERGWNNFGVRDFRKLGADYGVNWLVLRRKQATTGLSCPYANEEVRVCRL